MAKKILFGALIFLLSVTIFSAASAKKSSGTWRLDGSASAEPRNFRMMSDDWTIAVRGREPTRQGLEQLHASASGQFSERSLATIREKILELVKDGVPLLQRENFQRQVLDVAEKFLPRELAEKLLQQDNRSAKKFFSTRELAEPLTRKIFWMTGKSWASVRMKNCWK